MSSAVIVVRCLLPRTAPWISSWRIRRSTVQRATEVPSRFRCAHTLSCAVDAKVRLPHPQDLDLEVLVTPRS